MAQLNKVFDRIGDWQNSRHRDFMLDDALDALQSMRKAELLEKAASLGVPASADADEDAVRAALEEHFRGVALEMARVAAGDEPELWDNQYMIALVGGLPSWWQDQHADEVRYREAEAQVCVLASMSDGHGLSRGVLRAASPKLAAVRAAACQLLVAR